MCYYNVIYKKISMYVSNAKSYAVVYVAKYVNIRIL